MTGKENQNLKTTTESEITDQAMEYLRSTSKLSPREFEVVTAITENIISAEEIGKKLGISKNTARSHLAKLMAKIGASSKAEILAIIICRIRTIDRNRPS